MRKFLTAAGLVAATSWANAPASAQRLVRRPGAFRPTQHPPGHRAAAVRAALKNFYAEEARFRVRCFGETRPVAGNASADGRRDNRRIEVMLIGRRATEFAGR